ncbi:hypothetical protein GIW82_10125 [Planomicrobium sp. YIM 101495]|nr:hypothetical protein [Planomicrobium sp. YIM 101495]
MGDKLTRRKGGAQLNRIGAIGFTISISIYVLVHFYTYFFPTPFLQSVLPTFGWLAVLFAGLLLPLAKIRLQVFLLAAAVVVLFVFSDDPASSLWAGILQMRSLIGLLLVVPMISWVLKEEPYIQEIMGASKRLLGSSKRFYAGLMAMTQVIAHFLLFGAVPMMYRFIDSFLTEQKDEAWENFKGTAILRGFALSTMWVISIPSFIFAVEALGATLWKSLLLGLFFASLGTGLSVLFARHQEKAYGMDFSAVLQREMTKAAESSRNEGRVNRDVGEFVFLFVSLFGTIFVVHEVTGLEFLLTIPLVIIGWTLLYFLLKSRPANFVADSRRYLSTGIANQAQQFSILLSAGVLIYALNESGIATGLVDGMNSLSEAVPFLNILLLIPFLVIILGFVGLGPLPVVVLVAGILEAAALPYPPELIVLAVTSGSVISILLSPFVMPIIILSSLNGLSGVRNGLRFNLPFAIGFYLLVQLFIQLSVYLL